MNTRRAKDDSVFHQARYASSPEFERGLIANLVAKRAAILDDASDREMIWSVQCLSHQAGGLAAVAKQLISKYGDRIKRAAMVELGNRRNSAGMAKEAIRALAGYHSLERGEQHSAADFTELCRLEAAESTERFLCEMCVNPAVTLETGPWFFPALISTLREFLAEFIAAKAAGGFITALGKKVFEVLEYTAYCRGLTLMQGEARLGKSHAARAWCEQHPGQARFVEVPCGNDDAAFFRDLARGLGLGNFLNYKVVQIRERVESVLLTGNLVLCLDEAQRLWPQTNFREGYPKRIVWVMTMANAGVPIAMVATPQFFATQKVVEKNGWNSAQLTGRISHYESLPSDLSPEDLMAVAKTVLPEANTQTLRALAVYARSSARYLAAIDSIAKRARYIAMLAKRAAATTGDVRRAMQESVIPADTKLHLALASGKKSKAEPLRPLPSPAMPLDASAQDSADVSRETLTARGIADLDAIGTLPEARQRAGIEAVLIGH